MKNYLSFIFRTFLMTFSISGAFILAGCGGGGGGETAAVTPTILISGVAAAGGPITPAMNGVVTIQDSASPAHTASTPTDANGKYAFTTAQLAGWTAPYLMEINYKVGGVDYNLHSAATASDLTSGSATINITPLTDLVIANLAGDIAANVFKNQATYSTKLTSTAIAAGASALATQLTSVLTAQGVSASVDLFRTSFTADGTGLDAVLDALKVTVDPATKSATITNRLDGNTITNDLTKTNTATLPAPIVAAPVTDLQAITTGFSNFSAVMAKAPSPTDPTLLAYFDQTSFKKDGQNLAAFLQEITSDPAVLGGIISFSDITLNPVPSWVTTVPTTATASYSVKFTVHTGGFPNGREEFIIYKNSSGNWILLGNQKVAQVRIEALETSGPVYSGTTVNRVNCTGLYPQIKDLGGIGINFAVVTGPGLPTAGVLLFATAKGINGNDFMIAAGDPTTYNGASTAVMTSNTSNCGFSSLYPLTDTAIAAIAASPMKYTVKLYKDLVSGTPNVNTATLVATYEPTLSAAPLTSAQLTSSVFTSAESATPAILGLATAATAGTTTISWTAPTAAGLFVNGVGVWVGNSVSGINNNVFVNLSGNATTKSVAVPQLANANYAGATINYMDNLFREYWTSF